MTRRNKFISIGLLVGVAIIFGIYLFPDDEPEFADLRVAPPVQTATGPHIQADTDTGPETKPAATESKSGESALSPPKETGSPEEPYVFYDETIMKMLGIGKDELFGERDKFKNTVVHVEWMDRIRSVLQNLDPEKLAAIVKNQTMHLFLKDRLNEAYLTGKIDHETFLKAVADLMKFHQKTYEKMLSRAEYEALFEVPPEAADQYIDRLIDDTPEYGFILNQEIPTDEVVKKIQGYTMEEVNTNFKKMMFDRDQIGKKIGDGSMTLEQARDAMLKSQQDFIAKVKMILSEDEIDTIFGSVANLESGMVAVDPPAVQGDSDIMDLGFEIENPTTSIDMVKEKLDQTQIEDIRFFYQQRELEREKLINKLDAGEITEEYIENTSTEMDSAFEENCREILTDNQYKLIFDKSEETNTLPPENPDESGKEGEPEVSVSPNPEAENSPES